MQACVLVEDGLAFVNILLAVPIAIGKHDKISQFKTLSAGRASLPAKGIELLQVYENSSFVSGFHSVATLLDSRVLLLAYLSGVPGIITWGFQEARNKG
jgi:hypothetical protein